MGNHSSQNIGKVIPHLHHEQHVPITIPCLDQQQFESDYISTTAKTTQHAAVSQLDQEDSGSCVYGSHDAVTYRQTTSTLTSQPRTPINSACQNNIPFSGEHEYESIFDINKKASRYPDRETYYSDGSGNGSFNARSKHEVYDITSRVDAVIDNIDKGTVSGESLQRNEARNDNLNSLENPTYIHLPPVNPALISKSAPLVCQIDLKCISNNIPSKEKTEADTQTSFEDDNGNMLGKCGYQPNASVKRGYQFPLNIERNHLDIQNVMSDEHQSRNTDNTFSDNNQQTLTDCTSCNAQDNSTERGEILLNFTNLESGQHLSLIDGLGTYLHHNSEFAYNRGHAYIDNSTHGHSEVDPLSHNISPLQTSNLSEPYIHTHAINASLHNMESRTKGKPVPHRRPSYNNQGYTKTKLTIHGTVLPENGSPRREFEEFAINREAVNIQPGVSGGKYELRNLGITVVVPAHTVRSDTETLIFGHSWNVNDFPPNIPQSAMASNVFHFLPHGAVFMNRITISIPIRTSILVNPTTSSVNSLKLMYSNTDYNESPEWHEVNPHNGDDNGPDYFFKDNQCYLMINRFCLYCVVTSNDSSTSPISCPGRSDVLSILMASLYGVYKQDTGVLQLVVTFQIDFDKPPPPKIVLGTLLDQQPMVLSDTTASLSCHMTNGLGRNQRILSKEEPRQIELNQIGNLSVCPYSKFHIAVGIDASSFVESANICHIDIYQNNKLIKTLFDESVSLNMLCHTTAQGPKKKYSTKRDPQKQTIKIPMEHLEATTSDSSTNISHDSFTTHNLTTGCGIKSKPAKSLTALLPFVTRQNSQSGDILPKHIFNQMCELLNNCDKLLFNKLCSHLGFRELCCHGNTSDNPAERLLRFIQVRNDVLWADVVDKLESVSLHKVAGVLRSWLTGKAPRGCLGVGESSDSSETEVVRLKDGDVKWV